MLEVRRIRANEGNAVRELRVAALSDTPNAFGATLQDELTVTAETHEALAADRAQSDSDAFFVAREDRHYVGMIGAFFDNATSEPFICSMWVQPDCRRNGIGKQLLKCVLDWLHSRGAAQANAWVTQSNRPAISFYENEGFVATTTTQPLPSNPALLETLYIRPLQTGQSV